MRGRFLALFFATGLVGYAVSAYGLAEVESRNRLADPDYSSHSSEMDNSDRVNHSAQLPQPQSSVDKPMWLQEEESSGSQSVSAMPDRPSAKIDQLQQQVQELRGKVEIQEHRFQELAKQALDNYQDLDLRMNNLVAAQAHAAKIAEIIIPEPGKDNSAIAASVGSEPIISPAPEDDRVQYHKAYSLAQSKQYIPSLEAFNLLIKTHPKSTYVPTAYFWMGEIYIIQSKYELAINSFNQIVLNYPTSPKVSEALFKIGYIEYARGNNKLAIKKFNEVKTRYPGTAAAKQAGQYLQKLKPKKA